MAKRPLGGLQNLTSPRVNIARDAREPSRSWLRKRSMTITVQQARELLGDEAVGMTDAQIAEFLALVEGLADIIIDTYIAENRQTATAEAA